MYDELKKVQSLLWKSDDRIDQETLFELQDYVAELILKVSQKENKTNDLVNSFPWLYKSK